MNSPNQILGTVGLLLALQAAGADVNFDGGFLKIGKADAIQTSGIQGRASLSGTTSGFAVTRAITATSAITANTSYTLAFTQWTEAQTYEPAVLYITTGAVAPGAAAFYAAVEAKIQSAINAGQILGTVSSTAGGVVFLPSLLAPTVQITGSLFTVLKTSPTLTAAGSSADNGSVPRTFTAGAAHNLVVGGLYRLSFAGVTGAGADDLNGRIIYGIPNAATTIALLGTTGVGAVVTTAATITVLEDSTNNLRTTLGQTQGYDATHQYIGVNIPYTRNGELAPGDNAMGYYACDITNNTLSNVSAYVLALVAALNGSNSAAFLNRGSF
jgi:hypothetical protein